MTKPKQNARKRTAPKQETEDTVHKLSVGKRDGRTVVSCKGAECVRLRKESGHEPWEVTLDGTDDLAKAQAEGFAAVHEGRSRRDRS